MRDPAIVIARGPEGPAEAIWGGVASLATFARRHPLGAAGGIVVIVMALGALLAESIAPHDPLETSFLLMLRPPGPDFLLGTDQFGRDIWSRVLYGSRTALLVGFSVSGLGTAGGLVLGPS